MRFRRSVARALPALAMVLALAGTLVTVAPVAAAQQPSGQLLLTGRAAADFRIPSDVRLVGSRDDQRHGLTYDRYQQYAARYPAQVEGAQLTVVRRGQTQVLVSGAHYSNMVIAGGSLIGVARAIGLVAAGSRLTESVPREVVGRLRRRAELRLDPVGGSLFYRVESSAPGVRQFHDLDARTGVLLDAWDAVQYENGMGTGAKSDRKSLLGGNTLDPADDLTSYSGSPGTGEWRMQSSDGRYLTRDGRNGFFYGPGSLVMSDNTNVAWANDNDWKASYQRAAVDAQYYAALTDSFYREHFGYDVLSSDPLDYCDLPTLTSIVHHRSGYANAFWDGRYMVYGDGDGFTMGSLAGGQDVVTHELSHAVTECRVDLAYKDEPGALNEAFSDIMAVAAEWDAAEPLSSNCRREIGQGVCPDWWIGEDVLLGDSYFGFRNLADPVLADQPSHYGDRFVGSWDNGGVHINSGIVNHAFYLMVNGGRNARCSGPTDPQADCDVMVPALGLAHAEQIMFAAFGMLRSQADFCEARALTVAAADELLYPGSPADHAAAELAWAAVGRSAADCETPVDFSIQPASRSIAVAPGASAGLPISLQRGLGSTAAIVFAVSDPAPSSASFAPPQSQVGVPPDGGTVVTFSVPGGAAGGTYPVVFSATDGATTRYASAVLIVDDQPPDVAVTDTLIVTGGSVSTAGVVPVQVSWLASDSASGVAAAQLEHSTNGGNWAAISAPGSVGGTASLGAAAGAHQFRVLGSDGAGNAASSGPVSWTLSGHQDSAATYTKSWSKHSAPTAWGATRYSKTRRASATFVFSGTDVAWVGQRGPRRGRAKVYLDGQLLTKVDLYASSLSERRIVFSATGLTAGPHTLKIVVGGTRGRPRVDIDGFVVLS